jgi:DNA-binding CsgD family transcriptional regulator
MLIKAGLTYKEIAAMMDISINGVKIARNRLRKKLNIENDIKTSDFINSF